jgi:glycosyltransferase involved in cell wall biosynthesis
VGTLDHEARGWDHATYNLVVTEQMLRIAEYDQPTDVWSNHVAGQPLALAPLLAAPLVTTVHEQQTPEKEHLFAAAQASSSFVAISQNQTTHFSSVKFADVIYNGVDTDELTLGDGSGGYFAWLGWVSPIKGTADAVQIAKRTGAKLKIAGMVSEGNQEYFDTKIKPHLGQQIEFVGEVDGADKVKFLGDSLGLISPLSWDEPFGLVAAEAMACGAPVLTTTRGAMPELVVDGETGFLRETAEELDACVERAASLDRAAIRQHVIDHFSTARMVDCYEKLYQRIIEANE